jgi:hypothetical protein
MWYRGLIIYLFIYCVRLRQEFFQRKECMYNKIVLQCAIQFLLVVQEIYNLKGWAIKDFYCSIYHPFWMEEKQIVGLWRWFFCLDFKECTETCQGYWWQNSSQITYIYIYIHTQGTENRSSCLYWFLLEDL